VIAMQEMMLFVLAGQSNMSGRGGVARLPDGSKFFEQEVAKVLDAYQPESPIMSFSAQDKWERAKEPLHQDIEGTRLGTTELAFRPEIQFWLSAFQMMNIWSTHFFSSTDYAAPISLMFVPAVSIGSSLPLATNKRWLHNG
jgi:hypothetical protein